MNAAAAQTLLTFLSRLLSRYSELEIQGPERQSLVYAEGWLIKLLSANTLKNTARSIAVIGPTQVGKSTVVNLLLGSELAQTSTLAGFTRHLQGFSLSPLNDAVCVAVERLLPHLQRVAQLELSPERLTEFSLTSVAEQDQADTSAPPLIVWDSPDFDSVSSRLYRNAVPALCALADRIIMVVSKEKYADQSVWEMLHLLASAGRSPLIVINKTSADSTAPLIDSMQQRLQQAAMPYSGLFCIPYGNDEELRRLQYHAEVIKLRHIAAGESTSQLEEEANRLLQSFLHHHWADWTTPIQQEHSAAELWREQVQMHMNHGIEEFKRDYLHNPEYRETLDRAVIRLLELMEIPGLAGPLSQARQLMTWPARKLFQLIHKKSPHSDDDQLSETSVLTEIIEHALLKLQRFAAEQSSVGSEREQRWWRQLWLYLQARQDEVITMSTELIRHHQQLFMPEIEAAADKLYRHLQSHPAKLNALRTARAGTDAAAVVFALKTGGIGLNDLFLTPAMLSFTAMLTEGAVGQYMRTVETGLKEKQIASVEAHIITVVAQHLGESCERMPKDGLYGLMQSELQQARQAIKELVH